MIRCINITVVFLVFFYIIHDIYFTQINLAVLKFKLCVPHKTIKNIMTTTYLQVQKFDFHRYLM